MWHAFLEWLRNKTNSKRYWMVLEYTFLLLLIIMFVLLIIFN